MESIGVFLFRGSFVVWVYQLGFGLVMLGVEWILATALEQAPQDLAQNALDLTCLGETIFRQKFKWDYIYRYIYIYTYGLHINFEMYT